MPLIQSCLNGRRILSGIRGVERGEIVDHSNVGNDHLQVRGGNHVPDQILDFRDVLVRDLQAAPGGHLNVERELPGIGLREKGSPQKRIDRQASDEHAEEQSERQCGTA